MKKINYHKGNARMITMGYGLFQMKRNRYFDSRLGGLCGIVSAVPSVEIVSHKSNLKIKLGKLLF